MPDKRKHRGPHPRDEQLFAPETWSLLRAATGDLCWLLDRGYASPSSLKLVGDRYGLVQRQRIAVARCACAESSRLRREQHRLEPSDLRGRPLWLDGYNVLTSIEAALAGGVILRGRDGCYRDMASMHGSYRQVAESVPAAHLLGTWLAEWGVSQCRCLLDSPVSNSGRLKSVLLAIADEAGWNWDVRLLRNPDAALSKAQQTIATSDSVILDRCHRWVNLPRLAIDAQVPQAYVVDLSVEGPLEGTEGNRE